MFLHIKNKLYHNNLKNNTMKKILPILLMSLLIFSCSNSETSKNSATNQEAKVPSESCLYSINTEEAVFQWTAFKTTAKVGVNGSFDAIEINNSNNAPNLTALIIETEFTINLGSVNSGNPERDEKLKEFFFGSLANTDIFTGIVEECEGNNDEGMLMVNLKMNEVAKQVKMDYKVEDNFLKISGTLDLLDWEAGQAVESINNACLDLHKGEDGVSKTWSDMEISVEVPLTTDCK